MTIEIIALLDRPSPSAFCMVPFVARDSADPEETLRVYGLRNLTRSRLERHELDNLVETDSALRLTDPVRVTRNDADLHDLVIGWLGHEFNKRNMQLRQSRPPVLPVYDIESHGGFWLDTPARIYGQLRQWTREAATDIFTGLAGSELAELMLWVLHESVETRAAVWHTRSTEAEKTRHVQWYARLERDAGRPITEAALEERFRAIKEEFATQVRSALQRHGRRPPGRSPLFTRTRRSILGS